MKWLLIALLLLAQDPELDRLVQQLGDSDPARREEAFRKIQGLGPRAQGALEKARESSDSEVRARATALLQQVERERLQILLEAKERQKQFPRITIDVADAPLEKVLEELGRQSGWVWDTKGLTPDSRTVTLKGKDLPMIEALERIGLQRRYGLFGKETLDETKAVPGAVFGDGVRFSFSRRAWSPNGEALGTVFETETTQAFDGQIQWSVIGIKTDRDLNVETCAIHSPSRVYVAATDLADPRLSVKGSRIWFCPTPVDFSNPKNGEIWRVGACQIVVDWPFIRVRMDNPLEERLLTQSLTSGDIKYQLKAGVKDAMGVGTGGGGGGRFGGSFRGKTQAWCGCLDQPARVRPNPPPLSKELSVKVDFGSSYAVNDIASISLTFHKPVEDAFELSSPLLR